MNKLELNEPVKLPERVVAKIKAGTKIEAIKELRLIKGIGLKEAKDLVDACESRLKNDEKAEFASDKIPPPASAAIQKAVRGLLPLILTVILFVWSMVNFVEVAGSLIIVANQAGYAKAEFIVKDVEFSSDPEAGLLWGLEGRINSADIKFSDPGMADGKSLGLSGLRKLYPVGREIAVWYNPKVTDTMFQGRTLRVILHSPDLVVTETQRLMWWVKFCFLPFVLIAFYAWYSSLERSPEETAGYHRS